MNLEKIKNNLTLFSESMHKETLTNKEFLVFVANLLLNFSNAGINNDARFANINLEDSGSLEALASQYPENLFIATLLQCHILLYWSKQIEE